MAVDQGVSPPANALADVTARGDLAFQRMPQLDTLRAFAVLLVIVCHWLAGSGLPYLSLYGMFGVTLFFVLSGFLITLILLAEKQAATGVGGGRLKALGRFYARRTLRIFPVYYLTLLLLYASGVADFRADFLWYVSYCANFLFYDAQAWIGPAPHLWTLSVEEQFYLLWPLLILFVPPRHLWKLIVATVLLGPISRVVLFHYSNGSPVAADFVHLLMPSCMDCFGLGALLAYQRTWVKKAFLFDAWPWRLLLAISLFCVWWYRDSYEMVSVLLYRLSVSVIALAMIAGASRGFTGATARLMENPVLIYLGKISYGLYLFHLFIPAIYAWLGLPVIASTALAFVVHFCVLLLVATVSWQFFEKPINNLKQRFAYPRRAVAQESPDRARA